MHVFGAACSAFRLPATWSARLLLVAMALTGGGPGGALAAVAQGGTAPAPGAAGAPDTRAPQPDRTEQGVASQPGFRPAFGVSVYSQRRQKLVTRLGARLGKTGRGIFLALGAGSEGGLDAPRQKANFLFLSGVDEAGAALALQFGEEPASETLFLRDPTARERIFDRPRLVPGRFDWKSHGNDSERQAALEATGFKSVEAAHRLGSWLRRELSPETTLFVAIEPVAADAPLSPALDLVQRLRARHPGLRVVDARRELEALRLVKGPQELERIEAAVRATLEGFRRVAPRIRPGTSELTLQAEMEAGFRMAGAQAAAFETIVASGANSTILHYHRNDGVLEAGELVLIDAGSEMDGYAADVTRTFPVSGEYDAEQKKLYQVVFEAQEAGIQAARPGATLEAINQAVRDVLEAAGHGEAVRHRCCHFVGLEVHDVGGRTTPLAEGMVFTIEPGLYFPERGIGIRLEDTFVLGAEGPRNLSGSLPRRAEELERFLARSR
ncbi:MAG: Xaa-Pro peptidase family protein [Acidobacteriota bacterium]